MRCFLGITIALFSINVLAKEALTILTWWDYIPQETIEKLSSDYKLELITYKSNEEAIAKILSNSQKYDLVILSNFSINVLRQQKVKFNSFFTLDSTNIYLKSLLEIVDNKCLPYLWSESVFFTNNETKKNRMSELLNISSNSKVILLDDMMEVFLRTVSDYNLCRITKGAFKSLRKCKNNWFTRQSFKNISYKTDLSELKDKNIWGYTWSGEIIKNQKNIKSLKLVRSQKDVVVSSDYICTSKRASKKIIKVSKILSNPTSIKRLSKKTGYFSPLKDHNNSNHERDAKQNLKDGNYIFIDQVTNSELRKITKWWNKVRYGK